MFQFPLDFLQGVKAARGDFRGTHVFDYMFDMKAWLKPHLELLNNHSHPHIFHLGTAICNTKKNGDTTNGSSRQIQDVMVSAFSR